MGTRTADQDTLSHLSARVRRHIRALGFSSEQSYLRWCREAGLAVRTSKNAAQMKQEIQKRRNSETEQKTQATLKEHVGKLGLGSVDAYRVWCRTSGFGNGLHKSPAQRAREIAAKDSLPGHRAADQSRDKRRDIKRTFSLIASGGLRKRDLTDPVLIRLYDLIRDHRAAPVRSAFLELILRADELGVLLDTSPVIDRLGNADGNTMLDGLLALSIHRQLWRRAVSEWQPARKSRQHLFGELARHLLAEYPVPTFMDEAWFLGTGAEAIRRQLWFVHIGGGRNIRAADIPIHMTKRMAHVFLTASDSMSISEALRWSQVIGLGGDGELADHVIATRLGEYLDNDEFWVDVVHFFVNNPMLDYDHFGPIVDYVYNQKSVAAERRLADGTVVNEPPEPDFSMKGRTVPRLLDLVDRWHSQLAATKTEKHDKWPGSTIRPFEKVEERNGHLIRWTIHELSSRRELLDEGRAMHHCVASYAPYCARGQKSVWSLSVEDIDTGYTGRVLTIAVQNASKRVVQARGRCNAMPGHHVHDSSAARVLKTEGDRLRLGRAIMYQWGEKESIHVSRNT